MQSDTAVRRQHTSESTGELIGHALEELRRATGWQLTFLSRIEGATLEIVATAGEDWLSGTHPLEATACFRMLSGLAPPTTADALSPDSPYHDSVCAELGVRSYSGHALRRRDGSVAGTLGALDRRPLPAGPAHRRLGEALARLLAFELERAELEARLAQTADRDVLTGLLNRDVFYRELSEAVDRGQRTAAPLGLVLIDLDRFRHVNETRGHAVGDQVLREAAARLSAVVGPGDVLARVGGQEFGWLMPGRDLAGAIAAAERAREALAADTLADGVELTLSAGVSDLAGAGVLGELHRRADRALAIAKESGGDLCVRYSWEAIEAPGRAERRERRARSQSAAALRALARAVDAKDPSTQAHSERVAGLAASLAGEIGWPADRAAALREAGLVHDVGKTGVPDAILFKPGPLTEWEYAEVRRHAELGAQIVADVLTPEQVEWVRHHHERFDGRGYPDGVRGEAISEGARLLALADAWDAMVNVRVYRGPLAPDAALAECAREAGAQFCPRAVTALTQLSHRGWPPD